MNKILSWKIKAGVYAYIYLPEQTTHVSTRIPEDSEKWHTIIGAISKWEESEYKHNFDIMADEVKKRYGVTIPWKDEYFNFADGNYVNDVNIIMLAGDGGGEGNGSIGDGIGGENDVFDEFKEAIQAEINAMAAAINAKNEAVKASIEQNVTETISDALSTINETNKELDNVRTDLLDKLSGATEAIEKASALFDLGEGNITAEDIQSALISVEEYGGWMSAYSANVINMWTDYDAINQEMGSVGDAVDAKKGLFTKIATHIDTINETVGTVEDTVNASLGLAQTVATWVDASASTVTDAKSWIDAKNGIISDTLNYINGDEDDTRSLKHDMNVLSGTIISEASTRIDGRVTNVMNEINAMSASVTTQITTLGEGVDSALTSVGTKFEAVCATVKTWITKTEELSGTAKDLRDEWTTQSGMIRSVSDMVAKTDDYGCVLGYVVVEETDERIELYKRINDDVHESVMDLEPNVWYKLGTREKLSEELQPLASAYYSFKMGSYISQKADEVVMSVVNDTGKTAAIRLAIADDTATMGMIADKIIMSGNVIMGAMSALTANIGGILIGDGQIKTIKGVEDKTGMSTGQTSTFHLDGRTGGFSASGAYIRGAIQATSLTLCGKGENGSDTSFEEYLDGKIPTSENIYQQVYNFINSEEFENMLSDGFITYDEMYDYVDSLDLGLSENETKDLVEKMVNARIPNVETKTENGVTTHTYSYVDENGERHENTWTTIENGDYVVLDKNYTGNSGTFIFSKDGLLQANNAIIYGEIHANTGEIGGFSIGNNILKVKDADTDDTLAFLNGSETYDDAEKGVLILGAGVNKGKTLYKYTSNEINVAGLNTIFLDTVYRVTSSVTKTLKIKAYTGTTNGNILKTCEAISGDVRYEITTITGGSKSDDEVVVGTYKDDDGEEITVSQKGEVVLYNNNIVDGNLSRERIVFTYSGKELKLDDSVISDINLNTKIYSDGTIETERLTCEDGFFGGEIDSNGIFKGSLINANGSLKNISIDGGYIRGNMAVEKYDTFVANSNYNTYFDINSYPLDSVVDDVTFHEIRGYQYDVQNSNGNNNGKPYGPVSVVLSKFVVKSGATVTFPKMKASLARYVPTSRCNGIALIGIECTYTPLDKELVNGNIFNYSAYSEGFCRKNKSRETIGFEIVSGSSLNNGVVSGNNLTYKFKTDTIVETKLIFYFHLSTYFWLGGDKAAGHVSVSAGRAMIKNDDKNNGLHIRPNGFYAKYGAYTFSVTESGITMDIQGKLSPTGDENTYKFALTEKGISVYTTDAPPIYVTDEQFEFAANSNTTLPVPDSNTIFTKW